MDDGHPPFLLAGQGTMGTLLSCSFLSPGQLPGSSGVACPGGACQHPNPLGIKARVRVPESPSQAQICLPRSSSEHSKPLPGSCCSPPPSSRLIEMQTVRGVVVSAADPGVGVGILAMDGKVKHPGSATKNFHVFCPVFKRPV